MAINTQTIRVDLSTDKVIPSAFTHQNDTARTLVFDMYNGGMPYTMTGNTVKFAYKSPVVDGQYTVIAGSSMASGTVSGNKVTVTLPVAYTKISGVGVLTMIITPSSGTIRPVNIRLVVQKSADGDDVIAGASDMPDYLAEVAEQYYSEYVTEDVEELKETVDGISLSDIVFEQGVINTSGQEVAHTGRVRSANYLHGTFALDTGNDDIIIRMVLYYNASTLALDSYVEPMTRHYTVGKSGCVSRIVLCKSDTSLTLTPSEVKRSLILEDFYSERQVFNYNNSVTTDMLLFEQGSIITGTGELSDSTTRVRTVNKLKGNHYIICPDDFVIRNVVYYNDSDNSWHSGIEPLANKYLVQGIEGCSYKMTLRKGDGTAAITPEDATTNTLTQYILDKLPSDDDESIGFVEVQTPRNLYNPLENTVNYRITSTGEVGYNNAYFCTGFIPLNGKRQLAFSNQKLAADHNGFSYISYYDATKTFIRRDGMPDSVPYVTCPEGAEYVRFNAQKEYSLGKEMVVNYGTTLNEYSEYFAPRVEDTKFNSSMDTTITNWQMPSFRIQPNIPEPQIAQTSNTRPLADLYSLYDALVTAHPNYVTKTVLGQDESETYDIPVYVFKTGNIVRANTNKPRILLIAGMHAAEKPVITAMYNFAYNLCNNLSDEIFSLFHSYVDIHIIPCLSPWGYVHDTRGNSNHVDINKNFPYKWEGGSDDPTDDRYRGESPLSEAENQIVVNYVSEIDPLIIYDFHTWGVGTDIETEYGEKVRYCFAIPSDEACLTGSPLFSDSLRVHDILNRAAYDALTNQTRIVGQKIGVPLDESAIGIIESSDNPGTIINYFASNGQACCTVEAAYHLTKDGTYDDYLQEANIDWIINVVRVALNELSGFPFIK